MVRDLLQGFVKGEWLESADLDSLEMVNSDFVSERMPPVQRHEDMIWRLKVGDHWIYLYLLLEFQSSPDRWMALRMLSYTVLLWERLVKQGELAPDKQLPPVLPIVLYNGERAWRASTDLRDLCYPAPRDLQCFQPSMTYLLLNEQKLARSSVNMQNLAAAVFQLGFSAEPADLRRVLQELASWVDLSASDSLRRSLVAFTLKWLKTNAPDSYPDEVHSLEGNISMLAQRMEQWAKDLRQEGLGEALSLQLESRFGQLSDAHQKQIEAASTSQLNNWLLKTLNASSVKDVFSDD